VALDARTEIPKATRPPLTKRVTDDYRLAARARFGSRAILKILTRGAASGGQRGSARLARTVHFSFTERRVMCASPKRWLPTAYRFLLACAFALTLGAGAAMAQADSTTANLSGFVRDPAGAVVPGATVTARNAEKNVVRTATSNDEGFYQLVRLPPGTYEVSVEASNFKKAVVPFVTF